ncbi:MAG TPA: Uma2 family endonuclease [Micromonosporaceae bacterium]
MTAALSEFRPPASGWTTNDLDALPDDGIRRELIDGVVFVSPSPTANHQIIAMRLGVALDESCPQEWVVTQGVEIRISTVRSLTPDILVTTASAAARNPSRFEPHEVVLAVEVVSPTSRAMDRVMKPALYAQAGVPLYWRVETEDGIIVHTHRLDPARELYAPTGEYASTVECDEPWPISIPIARLTPRRLAVD